MKSIKYRILLLTLLPFLIVSCVFSAFFVFQFYRIQIQEIRRQLHNIALYNEVNLKKCYEIMVLSVQISASELEKINPDDYSARETGDHIITSRFRNPYIINAWMIFEPNAFDGRDQLHTDDYPGAPSGRYVRSFIRDGNSWRVCHDIDESVLDVMNTSNLYILSMGKGSFYTDFGSDNFLWDYGYGPISTFSVTEPVLRNGRIIGCVGLDAVINEETLGERIYPNSVSAIFLQDGRLGYSLNIDKIGLTLEELGFDDSAHVTDRLQNNKTDFFYSGNSGITGEKSYIYFYPVEIQDNLIYIYTSIPQRDLLSHTVPVILPIGFSFLISLFIFSSLFIYLLRYVITPLAKLTEASESIVSGNLEMTINVVNSADEMGMISKSLLRMAEQFRTANLLQERYYSQFEIILKIHYALFRSYSLADAFCEALDTISGYFGAGKASFVFVLKEKPTIVATFPVAVREEGDSEFFAHNHIKQILEGKKLFSLNGKALEAARYPFLDFNTKSLCILPLWQGEILRGYIIMEGTQQEPLVHDDTTLLFLGDALSYIIGSKVDWENEGRKARKSPERGFLSAGKSGDRELLIFEDDEKFLEKAGKIQYLNTEKGMLLIGGDRKKYAELLMVSIMVISEEMVKMRRHHTDDIAAFAIEIHGMKAALYNIGAESLGDEARQLEFAAKSDDADYCRDNYPLFEEKLRAFSRSLAALFPHHEQSDRIGQIDELEAALVKARQACDDFDVAAANSLLLPLVSFKWDDETIQKSLHGILKDMENLEYDEMAVKISALLDFINGNNK